MPAIEAQPIAIGDEARVHFNLHRGDFAVILLPGARVCAYVDDITLADVTFVVQAGGLQRVRLEGRRQVIAYARGTIAAINQRPDLVGMRRVTFNPKRLDTDKFTCDGADIEHAGRVTFAAAAGWIAGE